MFTFLRYLGSVSVNAKQELEMNINNSNSKYSM